MEKRTLFTTLAIAIIGILPAFFIPALGASSPAETNETQTIPGESKSAASPSREYHLKAAFLRYVAKFVEWPANVITGGTLNLCVLGLVPSMGALESIDGKDANEKKIEVTKITDVNEAKSLAKDEAKGPCQILFITQTEEENVPKILKAIGNLPILTFGDMEHFAEKGGSMNFYELNNRLAIMINPPVVEKANLKISERMLKVVTVIPPVDQSKRPST